MASGYYNGKIYLVGGAASIFGGGQPQFWAYDPLTDSYNTTRANMPQGVGSAGYGIVNGHFYVLGGFNASGNYLNTIYDYDIAGNSWTLSSVTLPVGPGVASPASAVLGNRIMFIGGFDYTPGAAGVGTIAGRGNRDKLNSGKGLPDLDRNITYIFDPAAGTVTNGPTLNEARSLVGGTYTNGYVIAVGGYNGTTYVGTNERSTAGIICPTSTPTPTVTHTPTVTPTFTATRTPTNSPTPTRTSTGGMAVTPTSIIAPSATPTVCIMVSPMCSQAIGSMSTCNGCTATELSAATPPHRPARRANRIASA